MASLIPLRAMPVLVAVVLQCSLCLGAGLAARLPTETAEAVDQFIPPEPPSGYTAKTIAYDNQDMVAAANPLAVQVGVDVLARGGSAVDAAIAVQMVLNLVEPQSSGIGGGAFMLHFDQAARTVLAYDGRETAPASASAKQFQDASGKPLGFLAAVDGGLSVGTPGLLRMLEAAHKAHGRLPWAALFAPAIKLAEDGFAISERLSVSIAASAARIKAQGDPAASYFLNADGSAKAAGTWLKNPALAATLRTIAKDGANAFYTGVIAQDIVRKITSHPSNPGRMTLADLRGYTSQVRTPVCAVYRVQYKICGMPAPSSGGIATLQTLGILQNFDLRAMKANTADSVHLISEAYRLAYADPDFVTVPQAGLLDAAYLNERAKLINMAHSIGTPVAGVPAGFFSPMGGDTSPELPSTSHMSIVDRMGNAVAMTTTIENGFGSLQMVRGFLLNNQLTDFSFTDQDVDGSLVANRVQALKRPRSSMAPTLVFNAASGALEAVIGSPSGSAIIQFATKTLIGLIDWQLNVQQAINLPNFGAQTNASTTLEKGSVIDTAVIRDDLTARGHNVAQSTHLTSGLHGVVFNGLRANGQPGLLSRKPAEGTYNGGSDPRREGQALGND